MQNYINLILNIVSLVPGINFLIGGIEICIGSINKYFHKKEYATMDAVLKALSNSLEKDGKGKFKAIDLHYHGKDATVSNIQGMVEIANKVGSSITADNLKDSIDVIKSTNEISTELLKNIDQNLENARMNLHTKKFILDERIINTHKKINKDEQRIAQGVIKMIPIFGPGFLIYASLYHIIHPTQR